jgi:hypothetical protein
MSSRPAGARPRSWPGWKRLTRLVAGPAVLGLDQHHRRLVAVFGLAADITHRLVQQDGHAGPAAGARAGRCRSRRRPAQRWPSTAIWPSTLTQPASIQSSASRRDAMPRSVISSLDTAGTPMAVGQTCPPGSGAVPGARGGRGVSGACIRPWRALRPRAFGALRPGSFGPLRPGSVGPRRGPGWPSGRGGLGGRAAAGSGVSDSQRRRWRAAAAHGAAARVAVGGAGLEADLGAIGHEPDWTTARAQDQTAT